jgi:acyl-CoA synthetase (NDP forming)
MSPLDRLIDPTAIAIAGLSADQGKHGARVLANLRRLGYAGDVWGVNPKLPDIEDVAVYHSVADLPRPPDLVVAAVPASVTTELVADCTGVGAVIVFASGFSETGPDGRMKETVLVDTAHSVGTRLLGPNSGGVIRPGLGLGASFLTCLDRPAGEIATGPVAVVTQSGGTGSYLHNLAASRSEGIAISVSTGNEADIELGEMIGLVSGLDEVRVIVAVIETIRDGEAFIAAARSARTMGKRVVVCPLGTGTRSENLMASHTGALAIPEAISRGVYASVGVTVAETPAEAYEVAALMARCPEPSGSRVGVVAHSGGIAILLSDLGERHGLDLDPPSPELGREIESSLDHGSATNPLDMGGIIGGPTRFAHVVGTFARSGEYDLVLAVSTAHPPAHTSARVDSLLELDSPVPVAHLWMAGDQGAEGLAQLRGADLPVAEEPRAAIKALAGLTSAVVATPQPDPIDTSPEAWGIPPIAGTQAGSEAEAVSAAHALGYPVVAKLESARITHKTELGGVLVDLRDSDEVVGAYRRLVMIAADNGVPDATIRVQRFRPGIEMIVGGLRHDSFGPLVSVGVGGVLTELVRDVVFAPAPLDLSAALAMIDRLRARDVLDGHRGGPPADVAELGRIVSQVSRGIAGSAIDSFEINPLIWDGEEWVVTDWLAL